MWTIVTSEVEVLLRDTVQLYTDLLRTDEFHHYDARTHPQYPYAHVDEAIEALFRQLRNLLVKGTVAVLEQHGYPLKAQQTLSSVFEILMCSSPARAPFIPQSLSRLSGSSHSTTSKQAGWSK